MAETKPGGAASPHQPPRPAASRLAIASGAPWQAAPGKARALGVALTSPELQAAAEFIEAPFPVVDANAGLGWVGEAMEHTRLLADAIEEAVAQAVAEKIELDVTTLRQTMVTNPQTQSRAALAQLKAGRFNTERAEWKRRLDHIFTTMRDKQERAVERLTVTTSDIPGDRVEVRASEVYWSSYTAWQRGTLEHLRTHLASLLGARWQEFAQEQADEVGAALECALEVALPAVELGDLPDPFAARRPGERDHYRTGAERLSVHDALDAAMEPPRLEYARVTFGQAVAEGYRKKFGWARGFGGVAGQVVALPLLGVAAFKGKAEAGRSNQEAEEKVVEMLKKQLVDEFRKRLDRHRVEVDRFVHRYASQVQQAVVLQLTERVNAELVRRQGAYSEKARSYSVKQQQLQARIGALQALNTLLMGTTLVELEARQRALLQEVMSAF